VPSARVNLSESRTRVTVLFLFLVL
jgi:hypothetical protein